MNCYQFYLTSFILTSQDSTEKTRGRSLPTLTIGTAWGSVSERQKCQAEKVLGPGARGSRSRRPPRETPDGRARIGLEFWGLEDGRVDPRGKPSSIGTVNLLF